MNVAPVGPAMLALYLIVRVDFSYVRRALRFILLFMLMMGLMSPPALSISFLLND